MANRSDDFNRTDSTETLNSPSDASGNYTLVGTWGVASNRGYSVSPQSPGVAWLETSATDVEVQVTIPVLPTNDSCGALARYVDTNNLVAALFHVSANKLRLIKWVSGSYTQVASASITPVAGDVLKLVADGDQFTVYVNGTSQIAATTISDAALQSSTKHGLYAWAETTARFDNLTITDISGSTAKPHYYYAQL